MKHSAINKVIFEVKSKKHIEELLRDVDTFDQESFSNYMNVIKLSNNYNLKDLIMHIKKSKNVSIIIPIYNESENISDLVEKIYQYTKIFNVK